MVQGPHVTVPQPLPHVLILHTGGTLGMNVKVCPGPTTDVTYADTA
jgi:L-asparaginase/Glu-tRNA(Gln) amidotransferase subunit D